jgi:hypothetical protein
MEQGEGSAVGRHMHKMHVTDGHSSSQEQDKHPYQDKQYGAANL